MLALGRVFYLIILIVVNPDFWDFTGCAVFEVFMPISRVVFVRCVLGDDF